MSLTYTYDGTAVTHDAAPSGLNVTHRADGEASFGGIPFEDPTASLVVVGHKLVTVEEDECAQPRLFTGFTTERGMARSLDEGLFVGANPRLVDMTVVDMNAALGFRQITGSDGNRPAETWADRLTWILESDYLNEFISSDQTWIVTNTVSIEAADYRDAYATAVLDDLVDRSGGAYVYFAFYDTTADEVRLFFDNDTEVIGACTLSISNVDADVDGATVFAPTTTTKLAREPDQQYSDVIVVYDRGAKKLYRHRPSTAAAGVQRGTSIQRPYTRGLATATAQAEKWLDKHATETDRITTSIQVPADSVGLIQAGQSIDVRFSHLPGYESASFTTMRIVSYSPKPTNDLATHYDVALELVGASPVAPVQNCSYVAPTDEPTYSSLDFFGSSYTVGGSGPVIFGTPVWPSTADSAGYGSGGTTTGTPNNGSNWGLPAGVCAGPYNMWAHWTWDLGTPTSMCVLWPATTAPLDAYSTVEIQGSNDDVTYDTVVAWPLGGRGTSPPGPAIEILTPPYPFYRYWRLFFDAINPVVGLTYYPGIEFMHLMMWSAGVADTVIDLGPTPGATTEHATDPTVDDDAAAGYTVGSTWINTTTGHAYILVDSTTGAAVWVSTTAVSVFSFSTSDGTTTVDPTTELTFVGATLADLGGGVAEVTWSLPSGTPGGELGGTWASPTVDATHAGSAHLALGSTSATAAAGDHTHAGVYVGELLMQDGVTSPPVPIENEAGDDWLYAD